MKGNHQGVKITDLGKRYSRSVGFLSHMKPPYLLVGFELMLYYHRFTHLIFTYGQYHRIKVAEFKNKLNGTLFKQLERGLSGEHRCTGLHSNVAFRHSLQLLIPTFNSKLH